MSFIKSFVGKITAAGLTLQIFFVLTAFGIMALVSYDFVNKSELSRMDQHVYSDLMRAQARIESDMGRVAAIVGGVSQTVQSMIARGESLPEIMKYMDDISEYARNAKTPGYLRFFMQSEKFNIKMLSGNYTWADSLGDVTTRPWYVEAVKAEGEVVFTDPYVSSFTGEKIITCARRIFTDDGKALGIIGMHITLEPIMRHMNGICGLYGPMGAYGLMFDSKAYIIMHPKMEFIGTKEGLSLEATKLMYEMKDGAKDSLLRREFFNYAGEKVMGSFKVISLKDWNIGLVMPDEVYTMHTRRTVWYFLGLNALILAALCYMIYRLASAKRKGDEFMRLVFDAVPLSCDLWDNNMEMVACNDAAVRLFGARSKQDYMGRFFDYSPEYQPCGKLSKSLSQETMNKAFADGYARFEWMHKTIDGKPLPSEVTLSRVMYRGQPALIAFIRDRREELAMLESLREAEEHIQSIYNAAPLSINTWDASGALIDCNNETLRVFGVNSRKELMDNFVKLAPDHQPDGTKSIVKLTQTLAKTFKDGHCRTHWEHRSTSGETLPFDVTFVKLKHKDGYIAVAYALDLREINAAMAKTREADERMRMMLDATPLSVTMWDRDANLIDCNLEAPRLLGIKSREEFIKNFFDSVPEIQPDGSRSIDRLKASVNYVIETGGGRKGVWHQYHVDGELIPFEAISMRIKYKDDHIVMIYCRDLREHNAMMAKLREADELREILFNASPISCTLYDENNVPIECNDETLKFFGAPSKTEYLRDYKNYTPEAQPDGTNSLMRIDEDIRKAMTQGYHRFEWTHRHSNGELIPCEVTLIRVKHKGNDIMAGYIRDLREFKAMVREAHRAEIAEESNQAKSRFLAAMSHEIRTPMNVILGVTDIQLQDDTLPPHLREAFTQIYNSSDLLLGIINDILDLSKIEADRMEFSRAKYSLASLINDTAHLNMMRNSKPIEFELDISEDAPTHLFGDELRIKQILNNLLSNAFKFTEEGHVKLVVAVEDNNSDGNSADDDVTLVMTVSDTGQGMSKDQVSKLFTEYTRFNLDMNRTIEGTGLGMNITRRLTHMMGGEIVVDSDIGAGTSVTVRLPQKRVGKHVIGKELAKNLRTFRVDTTANLRRTQITRDYMPYGRVLIVDDVESNLYVARGLMASYGLSIDTAMSGQEALDKIKAGKMYDIIFMDHMMPKMDGIEAAKLIRESGYTLPIVALTANAVVGQADIFLSNGFNDFISKPIDIRQLNAILNRLVRDKQTPEILERARAAKERMTKSLPLLTNPAADPELLTVFARDAAKTLPSLEALAADTVKASDEELQLFTINAHAMKSALANIGESRLSQVAHTLEKAGKANDKNTIAMQTPSFVKALKGLIDKAEAECKLKDCATADEDPKLLREQLGIIAKACWDYDERAVDAALCLLKEKSWTAETEDVLNKIAELQLHSSFEEAAEVAALAAKRVRG